MKMVSKKSMSGKESRLKEESDLTMKQFKLRLCVYRFIDSLIGTVFFFSSPKYEEAFRYVLVEEMMSIFVNLLAREEELSRKINQEKINSNKSHLALVKKDESNE